MPCLTGQFLAPSELTEAERTQMLSLFSEYFENVTRAQFERDLSEKEWVLVLRSLPAGCIKGFSTLMRLSLMVDDNPVTCFYSGDTVVHRECWNESELARQWGRHVFNLAERVKSGKVYWYLISSGYKTYRFLSVFFNEFYPTYRRPTPTTVQRVLDALGDRKFRGEYDRTSGVIRLNHATPLRPQVAELTPHRLRDPDVAYFLQANPGHGRGEQLACLAELCPENLTAAGRRVVGL
ncbi:MAG: hypothetical protein AB1898_04035 [Acidobacteriota bacterium]